MLACCDISYGYTNKTNIISRLSLHFEPKKFTAIIGANGCGKSTLLKCIMGFLPLKSGKIMLNDVDIRHIKPKDLARQISYLPQHPSCPDYLTVGELVELGRYAYLKSSIIGGVSKDDRQHFQHCLEQVGLVDMASVRVNTLSGGQRQRAWLAMVLSQDSDIIILDEPVNHLDINYQHFILSLIRELMRKNQKTVVSVLHDLNQTSVFADSVFILGGGHIIDSGSTKDTLTDKNIRASFDFETVSIKQGGHYFYLPNTQNYETSDSCNDCK